MKDKDKSHSKERRHRNAKMLKMMFEAKVLIIHDDQIMTTTVRPEYEIPESTKLRYILGRRLETQNRNDKRHRRSL